MSKIEIFEAAGCCATSSVVVSDEAVKWNACNDPLKSCSGHNEWRSQT